MAWVDWLVLAGVAVGVYRGYQSGVVRQVISIAGWFVAFVVALQLMDLAGEVLAKSLPINETLAPILGFALVVVIVRFFLFLLRESIESLLDAFHLSLVNRLGGGALGAVQGVLVVSLIFLAIGPLGLPRPETRRSSPTYAPVAAALPETWDAAAEHFPRMRTAAEQFGRHIEDELSRYVP